MASANRLPHESPVFDSFSTGRPETKLDDPHPSLARASRCLSHILSGGIISSGRLPPPWTPRSSLVRRMDPERSNIGGLRKPRYFLSWPKCTSVILHSASPGSGRFNPHFGRAQMTFPLSFIVFRARPCHGTSCSCSCTICYES